jgi:hypothetical protein
MALGCVWVCLRDWLVRGTARRRVGRQVTVRAVMLRDTAPGKLVALNSPAITRVEPCCASCDVCAPLSALAPGVRRGAGNDSFGPNRKSGRLSLAPPGHGKIAFRARGCRSCSRTAPRYSDRRCCCRDYEKPCNARTNGFTKCGAPPVLVRSSSLALGC